MKLNIQVLYIVFGTYGWYLMGYYLYEHRRSLGLSYLDMMYYWSVGLQYKCIWFLNVFIQNIYLKFCVSLFIGDYQLSAWVWIKITTIHCMYPDMGYYHTPSSDIMYVYCLEDKGNIILRMKNIRTPIYLFLPLSYLTWECLGLRLAWNRDTLL